MKKNTLLLFIMLISFVQFCNAQSSHDTLSSIKKPEIIRDRLMVDVFHTFWMGMPSTVNVNKLHPGFNISAMWDFKLPNKGPFSFGLGLGVSYYTQFSDARLDIDPTPWVMRYYVIDTANIDYDLNRMTYINCNIPLEFRYRHQNGFKISLGVRVGLVAEISQTYKGKNPNGNDDKIWIKNYEMYNKQKYNFDVYLRTGWKYVSFYYCLQVTKLFQDGKGPQIYPMSIGLTWNIF